MCYILHCDWSLLLLVNIQVSLHCKQGMLLVNIQLVYTVNKVAYRKHYFTTTNRICQDVQSNIICYYRNNDEVENIIFIFMIVNYTLSCKIKESPFFCNTFSKNP